MTFVSDLTTHSAYLKFYGRDLKTDAFVMSEKIAGSSLRRDDASFFLYKKTSFKLIATCLSWLESGQNCLCHASAT